MRRDETPPIFSTLAIFGAFVIFLGSMLKSTKEQSTIDPEIHAFFLNNLLMLSGTLAIAISITMKGIFSTQQNEMASVKKAESKKILVAVP